MSAPRVSVVMATYNSGSQLEDVFASLDAQSLDPGEFEIVAVDDGSTDDTFALLQRLASERTNVIVSRIPNSGWPGRPRNVGVSLASGEYVLFMDHDDYVFPEALERMHDFAVAHDLDVVLAKEVVSGYKAPAHTTWIAGVPRVGALTPRVLELLTPHKLYRRSFVEEKEIAFPEGRIRLEDYDYNAQVYSQTRAIGILADYPCYRWNVHGGSSHRASFDREVYWRSFERSVAHIERHLPDGPDKDNLLVRWYRSRILGRLGPKFVEYSESYRASVFDHSRRLLEHFPPALDALLSPAERPRSWLLRQGDVDGLLRLGELDARIRTRAVLRSVSWETGKLQAVIDVRVTGTEKALKIARTNNGFVRVLPDDLSHIPTESLDYTSAWQESDAVAFVRARGTSVDWAVPARWTPRAPTSGAVGLSGELVVSVDPLSAALGEPLNVDVWDVSVRLIGPGFGGTVNVTTSTTARPALVGGTPMIGYRTKDGRLALDVGSQIRTVFGSPRPATRDIRVQRHGSAHRVSLTLPGVHSAGDASLAGALWFGDESFPATLAVEDGKAVISADAAVPAGVHDVRAEIAGRRSTVLFLAESRPPGHLRMRATPDQRRRVADRARPFIRRSKNTVSRLLGR